MRPNDVKITGDGGGLDVIITGTRRAAAWGPGPTCAFVVRLLSREIGGAKSQTKIRSVVVEDVREVPNAKLALRSYLAQQVTNLSE